MISGTAERWVVNASPVILLGKAGIIHLLPKLCAELVVPKRVLEEVAEGQAADVGREWLNTAGRPYLRPVPKLHPAVADWNGGAGEAEVITWALQNPGFIAILDDRAARNLAVKQGVPVIGSLRVIVLAKERGLIPQARDVLEKLRGAGAYPDGDSPAMASFPSDDPFSRAKRLRVRQTQNSEGGAVTPGFFQPIALLPSTDGSGVPSLP